MITKPSTFQILLKFVTNKYCPLGVKYYYNGNGEGKDIFHDINSKIFLLKDFTKYKFWSNL
jgi:hypothetical protein